LKLKFPKTFYGKLLIHKQKVKKFYNSLTEHQLRQLFIKSDKHLKYWISNFYYQLERRVDSILYRSNFVRTITKARQLIIRKKVLINNVKISRSSITMSLGDFLYILKYKSYWSELLRKLYKKRTFLYYPSYLVVNYKIFTTIIQERPIDGQVFFAFHFNPTRLANFYRSF